MLTALSRMEKVKISSKYTNIQHPEEEEGMHITMNAFI